MRGTRSPGEARRGRQGRGRPGESQKQVQFEGSLGGWWEEPGARSRQWENHMQRPVTQTAPLGRQAAGAPGVWTGAGGRVGFFRRTRRVRAHACEPGSRLSYSFQTVLSNVLAVITGPSTRSHPTWNAGVQIRGELYF